MRPCCHCQWRGADQTQCDVVWPEQRSRGLPCERRPGLRGGVWQRCGVRQLGAPRPGGPGPACRGQLPPRGVMSADACAPRPLRVASLALSRPCTPALQADTGANSTAKPAPMLPRCASFCRICHAAAEAECRMSTGRCGGQQAGWERSAEGGRRPCARERRARPASGFRGAGRRVSGRSVVQASFAQAAVGRLSLGTCEHFLRRFFTTPGADVPATLSSAVCHTPRAMRRQDGVARPAAAARPAS